MPSPSDGRGVSCAERRATAVRSGLRSRSWTQRQPLQRMDVFQYCGRPTPSAINLACLNAGTAMLAGAFSVTALDRCAGRLPRVCTSYRRGRGGRSRRGNGNRWRPIWPCALLRNSACITWWDGIVFVESVISMRGYCLGQLGGC